MNVNKILGRDVVLFRDAIAQHEDTFAEAISGARVLLFGGAGSIGREVAKQIFLRKPSALHVIDINENNLVELVRELRSSLGYIDGETRFLPIDMSGLETEAFLASQARYDYILNLAAMKHVRSEKDGFSLMRMVQTNVLDAQLTFSYACLMHANKYFVVSSDKAKNPANLMGATKRIMEDVLFMDEASATAVSTARLANVAFSDGSLLHGFTQRLQFNQPISAPRDVRRYFVTGEEAGLLCLASIVTGRQREIYFPSLDTSRAPLTFSELALRFVRANGYEPIEVASEDEGRDRASELILQRKWPCYFFESDTAGEKPFEEFYSQEDLVEASRYRDIGVIRTPPLTAAERERAQRFLDRIVGLRGRRRWQKFELVAAIYDACPELVHVKVDRFLDEKM